MEKVLLLGVLVSLVVFMNLSSEEESPLSGLPDHQRFVEWCSKYQKVYGSKAEE